MKLWFKCLLAFTAFNISVLLVIAWMEHAALGAFVGVVISIIGLVGYSIYMDNKNGF